MAPTAGPARTSRRWLARLLRTVFWPANTSQDLRFLLASAPVQFAVPAIVVMAWLTVAGTGAGIEPGAVIPMPVLLVLVVVAVNVAVALAALPALTAAQRHLLRVMRGVDIPAAPRARRTTWRGLMAWLRAGATWRQLAYHAFAGPVLALADLLMPFLWAAGVALAAIFVYVELLKSFNLKFVENGHAVVYGYLTVLGLLALAAAPRVGAVVIRLDIRAARALLGPSRVTALEHRVETLTESRAGVVDAADAERRRIERDLHDGAQQRLVSLAMHLGLARQELGGLPEDARRVIAEAHEEAKEALAELRHLARGLHPAILEDRGLDAALSGLAARSPVPVRLDVHLPDRAPPTVEAVAYFVASEALANIAKHSGATRAEIGVRRAGEVLRVAVTDDGMGGADPSLGTGLAGLEQRVRSVDGSLAISSPAGGPTVITAELPCAW
jgi:signal transduction histidine kinase